MAFAAERYSHFVWASGGSNGADLSFADDGTAVLDYRSGWMGSSKREFRLRFRVKRFSDRYGLLALTEAERLDTPQRWSATELNEAACGFHEDDERMLLWGVAYEFLRLDGGEGHVPNDPHLMDFPNAGWNPRMDLVLFARVPAESLAEGGVDTELSAVLAGIDKLKLGRVAAAAPGTSLE
ncbi:hypothetical protein J0H58_00745 [bacterium]|nr:hypothetical protein [bacterium]